MSKHTARITVGDEGGSTVGGVEFGAAKVVGGTVGSEEEVSVAMQPKVDSAFVERVNEHIFDVQRKEGSLTESKIRAGLVILEAPVKLGELVGVILPKADGRPYTEGELSKWATVAHDYVVVGKVKWSELRSWSFDMLYHWSTSLTNLPAADVVAGGKRTVPPKVEELPVDAPKVKRAAKKAGKGKRASSRKAKPGVKEAPASGALAEGQNDKVSIQVSKSTRRALKALQGPAETLDDVIERLLARAKPSGKRPRRNVSKRSGDTSQQA